MAEPDAPQTPAGKPKTPATETPAEAPGAGPADAPVVGGSRREQIQSRIVVLLIVVGVLAAFFWPKSEGPRPAPWGEIETAEGEVLSMQAAAEPVTLVHFWATWCIPCLDEVPQILRLEQERPDVSVLMVAVGDHVPDVEKFLSERAGGAETYFDHKWGATKKWGTSKLPETHLVVDGHVVETFQGATDWDDGAIRRRIADAVTLFRTDLEAS